jgi:small subunit ribosomal protein S6
MENDYRATFILDTRNYEEPVETLIQKIKDAIVSLKGSISSVENLGNKQFVRITDRKFPAGYYIKVDFKAAATLPKLLKDRFALDKTIDRIMIESI